jgi:histidine triad (HIT) family protein
MKKGSAATDDNCIFCRIVKGTIPATIVSESDDAIVFRDINPQAPTHLLIVPRRHVASIEEATDADGLGDLLLFAARVAREEGLAEKGYRIVINTGEHGGQTVDHLHFHVLGGRHLKWPPG